LHVSLATVLISVFTLCYGQGLLFRGPLCIYLTMTNKMHTISHSFLPIKLSSTRFEQIIVHHQEVISVHTAYSILPCIYGVSNCKHGVIGSSVILTYHDARSRECEVRNILSNLRYNVYVLCLNVSYC